MLANILKVIDWFIPEAATAERSDLSLARNFVFTHLSGPLLSQSITVFLYMTDPNPGFAFWTMAICISSFWALPFVLKATKNLRLTAVISVEMLAFASLFGAFHYGGVSSPFLPWLIVSLLLGFFYLSERPLLVIGMFAANISIFLLAFFAWGFPQLVPLSKLTSVGWISILSGTIYMSWMAIYYANIMTMRSDLERETERHLETAVRLRRAKERAETANRSKSIFLAKMSHELRTPLNAVIGYSEILLESIEPGEKGKAREADLHRINGAGKHLLSLVTDVLDLSKIEANQIDVRVETFELAPFLDEVAATAQHLIATKSNKLVMNFKSPLGSVTTDSTKLRQIVLNLLSNAAKFTERGMITLYARRDSRPFGDWIEIQVRDTGIGISSAEIGRLFQDFGQANSSTSSKYGGTGLGLALSQKLCALMGGGISVTSEPGRGSNFIVRLPAEMSDKDAATTSDEAVAPATAALAA